jgi:hypothetical protein
MGARMSTTFLTPPAAALAVAPLAAPTVAPSVVIFVTPGAGAVAVAGIQPPVGIGVAPLVGAVVGVGSGAGEQPFAVPAGTLALIGQPAQLQPFAVPAGAVIAIGAPPSLMLPLETPPSAVIVILGWQPALQINAGVTRTITPDTGAVAIAAALIAARTGFDLVVPPLGSMPSLRVAPIPTTYLPVLV